MMPSATAGTNAWEAFEWAVLKASSPTAAGRTGISPDGVHYLADFLGTGGESTLILAAISCGAVMMGANTYIGNGPNFMVKAIAEQEGVKMPSFGGYMIWSTAILLPVFVLVTFIFFRGPAA
jgi:hypothetical protein